MQLVRHHSHWGAFFAEVDNGRVVGVQPFERDPDPSHLIEAYRSEPDRAARRPRTGARASITVAATHDATTKSMKKSA